MSLHKSKEYRVYLQLGNSYFELYKITEEERSNNDNSFIKVSEKTFLPTEKGRKKIHSAEFTMHPTKTSKKYVFEKNVRRYGDFAEKFTKNYHQDTIYENTGYTNAPPMLLIDQSSRYGLREGVELSSKKGAEINSEETLMLSIEYNDPFWSSIIFTRLSDSKIRLIFKIKRIQEFKIIALKYGKIIIAVRKLIPEWEKYNLKKDPKNLSYLTKHERLSF